MIVVPFCSLVPAVIIPHTIVGPIGWKIGDAIAAVVYMGLTSQVKWLFAAVFGLIYAPVVMTGLHHMTNAIDSQLVNLYQGTILWPMIALSNIAQGSAVLAMSVLQKKNERAQQVNIPACISCYLGVTEPALFGVNLKNGFPLVCGMIGSSVAAVIATSFQVEAYSIGVGGLPGILSIKPQYWLGFLIAMAAAIVIPFGLTIAVGSRRLSPADRGLDAAPAAETTPATEPETAPQEDLLVAPLSGKVIPLSEIPDQVFSQGILGEGVGIDPTGNFVVAPANATVSSVIEDSKHACGLTLDNGMEMLIHVGMDTVAMKGDGFELYVKVGDRVKTGDKLISFDLDKIRAAGHPTITAVVVPETAGRTLSFETGMDAQAGTTPIIRFE